MPRHAAVCRGGPLDGYVFSVEAPQNEIIGIGGMKESDVYDRISEPVKLDSLVEDRDRASDVEDPLEAMKQRLFPNQEVVGISLFEYRRQ